MLRCMAKTHPHLDAPTPGQLRQIAGEHSDDIVEAYLTLHQIVLDAVPELSFSVDTVDASVGYGAHQFGYNGWGVAALTPYRRWVSLTLLQGARLADPHGLLTGTSTMRHVKVSDASDVENTHAAITGLILAAVGLYQPLE